MRYIFIVLTLMLLLAAPVHAEQDNEVAIIIEVEGDPAEHAEYFQLHYPQIHVVATYEKLFNGVALKAEKNNLARVQSLDFVKALHPVVTYETNTEPGTAIPEIDINIGIDKNQHNPTLNEPNIDNNAVLPSALNDTIYTGKGVQVAVIDTGIDYDHPDLKGNYAGGFDLVDLDDDPMETLIEEGMPTLHGTHVAGIIAANGKQKGVAPEADIYAYRALGPGGQGTSVQVIAALEQAVKDGADVINLSLGNTVNGPDFPTSVAVNRAVEMGVGVVIANGNSGPKNWTVGSPATATKALSVGASTRSQTVPYLFETLEKKKIPLVEMLGSKPWDLKKDYEVTPKINENVTGKIVLVKRGENPFYEKAKKAEEAGAEAVLIYNNEKGAFRGSIENASDPIEVPVASITKADGKWLLNHVEDKTLYMDTRYKTLPPAIADFSSRGPVTVNWQVKPEVSAPGANILSTVPGGYMELQGTSMAAPHVTGAMALLKEAHPAWSVAQLTGALKTTAQQITNADKNPYAPIIQGMGEIQPEKAIHTRTIIHNPLIAFGKTTKLQETKTIELHIENTGDSAQTYTFNIPKKQQGISWIMPRSFTIPKGQSKKVPVTLKINSSVLQKGIHQGWLTLQENRSGELFQLPYMFINKKADYPKAMGFQLTLKPFSKNKYAYQFYVAEEAEKVDVTLYNPDTLVYEQQLIKKEHVEVGMNEGILKKNELGTPGNYLAVITIYTGNGDIKSYQTAVHIPE